VFIQEKTEIIQIHWEPEVVVIAIVCVRYFYVQEETKLIKIRTYIKYFNLFFNHEIYCLIVALKKVWIEGHYAS